MRDQQGGAVVIAGQTPVTQVLLDLKGKQIPAPRHKHKRTQTHTHTHTHTHTRMHTHTTQTQTHKHTQIVLPG